MTEDLPDSSLADALRAVAHGAILGTDQVASAFAVIMAGGGDPVQSAGLLMGLRARGETPQELAGVARALRASGVRVDRPEGPVIDTCGTGGGRVGTFNVSTAAAFVAVAAGAVVAKHGNRSYTSRCGSADVLEALGIPMQLDRVRASVVLREVGIVFLYAPAFHPAMRHLAPVRKALGVPTIMNLVGPLANPAGVRRQVVGVADPERGSLMAEALVLLETEHALVVHADVGMDEIAPAGLTRVWEVRGRVVTEWQINPAAFGLAVDDLAGLAGGEPRDNADRLRRLFADPDADRVGAAAVTLNAGAALYVAAVATTLAEGVERARAALASGAAAERLGRLVAASSAG